MITVENLQRNYGAVQALRGVTFHVPTGQVCGYLGPNGAGKSTTVRMLTGLLAPSAGSASVAGFDVVLSPLEVKRRIGYVPETGAVYSTLTPNEYLTLVGTLHELPPQAIAERSRRMLELFEMSDAADRRLDSLSKGQRQKVVISAALIHDPAVILFDEPLSGLDANAAGVIRDLVLELARQGKTILYCSHVLDVVERLCDRVIILHHGQIVADGATAALVSNSGHATLNALFRSLTAGTEQARVAPALIAAMQSSGAENPQDRGPGAGNSNANSSSTQKNSGKGGRR